jgi:hypothetical protein
LCRECTSLGSRGIRTGKYQHLYLQHLYPFLSLTNVSLFHSIPLALLASVYEKPSTEPVWRPNNPCKLGPILFPSPSPRVWHWAHRVLKRLAPFFASPVLRYLLASILSLI